MINTLNLISIAHAHIDESSIIINSVHFVLLNKDAIYYDNTEAYKNDKHLEFNFNCSRTYR